jgi:cell division septation protein DedD
VTARKRDRHPVAAVVGLALLAIPGFALGVLAGVAWEEPGLLLSHLLGRTVDVPWGSVAGAGTQAPEPSAPETVAGPEALPAVAAPGPKPAREPAPRATRLRPEVLSPAAKPGTGGSEPGAPEAHFAVQVGAFGESRSAEHLAERLRGKGFDVYVSPSAQPTAARWRVRVGPLPSREQAEHAAARLKAEEKLPTWVLDEDAL